MWNKNIFTRNLKCTVFWENIINQNRIRTFEYIVNHGIKCNLRNNSMKLLIPDIFIGDFYFIKKNLIFIFIVKNNFKKYIKYTVKQSQSKQSFNYHSVKSRLSDPAAHNSFRRSHCTHLYSNNWLAFLFHFIPFVCTPYTYSFVCFCMLYKWNHIIHIGNEERMRTVIATPRMKKKGKTSKRKHLFKNVRQNFT